jgi:hypothetical protein
LVAVEVDYIQLLPVILEDLEEQVQNQQHHWAQEFNHLNQNQQPQQTMAIQVVLDLLHLVHMPLVVVEERPQQVVLEEILALEDLVERGNHSPDLNIPWLD